VRASDRILDAVDRAGECTGRQLLVLAGLRVESGHKAVSLLKRDGLLRVVRRIPANGKRINVYALTDPSAEAYRETDEQAATFSRLFRAQHPEGFG
jgi:hypothetical protein